jgi:transcriptional regulator with XRE-family HTH domain
MDIQYTLSELQRAGLTQTQIANEIGLKQPTVSEMANGLSGMKRPSYQVISGLERLAREHNIPTAPPHPQPQPQ